MLVVVGGHARHIGKTSVVAGLIGELRDGRWTALKITPHSHGSCAGHAEAAQCGRRPSPGGEFALTEERHAGPTDTGRFLAAGAERSFWLRVPPGEMARAAGIVRELLAQGGNVIVESASLVELVAPDVFLMVLDYSIEDFKASSPRRMERADGFVVIDHGIDHGIDRGIDAFVREEAARKLWAGKARFRVKPPCYVTPAMADFVRAAMLAESPG